MPYGLPRWLSDTQSAGQAGDMRLIPGLGGCPGEGNGNPLQYSFQTNSMDIEACWATVYGVASSCQSLSHMSSRLTLDRITWPISANETGGSRNRMGLCGWEYTLAPTITLSKLAQASTFGPGGEWDWPIHRYLSWISAYCSMPPRFCGFGLHRSTSRIAKWCSGVCQDYVKGWRRPPESAQTLFPILFQGSLEIGHGP